MDSLTQGLLGAATFALVKDRNIGKKSLTIGAIAGTIPDLDVCLAPFFNEVEFLTVHRSVSHSIVFAVLAGLMLAEVFHRAYRRKFKRTQWQLAFFLSIWTHALLDWCTTYGTKLISPFNDHLFSLNSIHVFEPIYTSILLIGVIIYGFKPGSKNKRAISYTLIISTCYLLLGIMSKNHAYHHFKSELDREGIVYQNILVSPTPLNSFLWHGIVKSKSGYYLATYSIFDGKGKIEFQYVQSDHEILSTLKKNRLVNYYLDYTQQYPLVKTEEDGTIRIYAIKYGPINYYGEPEFVYPLTLHENDPSEKDVWIDYRGKQRGPVKNYKNLLRRIIGYKSS